MATIGQVLTTPESGWRRYDDQDSRIKYDGIGISKIDTGYYNSTMSYIQVDTIGKIIFKFYGTKFRILSDRYTEDRSSTIFLEVYVDDVLSGTYTTYGTQNKIILHYEILGLALNEHKVEIVCNELNGGALLTLDAIDIDSTGYLLHPILTQKTSIDDMEIGDCIPCKYTAGTSRAIGYFSQLGTGISNEIPVLGSVTPNGLFYFIKADKGLLIADRMIQSTISWNAINAAKYIEGRYGNNDTYYSGSNSGLLLSNNYTSNFTLVSSSNLQVTGRSSSAGTGQWNRSISINNNVSSFYLKFKFKQITMASLGLYLHHNNTTTNNIIGMSISRNSISNGSIIVYNGDLINKDIQIYGNKETGELVIHIDRQLIYYGSIAYIGSNWGGPVFQQVYATNSTTNATIEFEYYTLNLYNNGTSSILFLNKDMIIRSLSGGNSYIGSDGGSKSSIQFSNGWPLGAWPPSNEWDKYVMHSNLNGKIVPGDNTIWNRSYYSWCRETPVNGLKRPDGLLGSNSSRVERGAADGDLFNGATWAGNQYVGFRPVIEYVDNKKQNNLWY